MIYVLLMFENLYKFQCAEFRNILKDAVPVTRAFHFIVS